jgi:hypothetical protein
LAGLFDKLKQLFGGDKTPREVPPEVPPDIQLPRPQGLHHPGATPTGRRLTPQEYFRDESVWITFVASSNLYQTAFLPDPDNPGLGFMGMRFHKKGVPTSEYWYWLVPRAKWDGMFGAASRGSYFRSSGLRLSYPYTKIW